MQGMYVGNGRRQDRFARNWHALANLLMEKEYSHRDRCGNASGFPRYDKQHTAQKLK
jgi:hypothetical protein